MKAIAVSRDFHLTTAFLVLLIGAATSRNPLLLLAYVLLALYVVLSKVGLLSRSNLRERAAILLLVLSLTLILPVSVVRNETALIHYCVALISLGCAFVLTRNIVPYLAASRVSLIAAQSTLFAYLLVSDLGDSPLENLFLHTSSNGITSSLILLQVNYSTVKFLVQRRASLVTSLLTLAICLIGYGRGSVLASAAVVVVNMLSSLSWRNHWRALSGVVLISGVVVALYSAYGQDIVEFVRGSTKVGAGLYDEARERMIADYLNQIDAGTLITGAGYHGTSIEAEFHGNPHNSYIRAHHIFGLPYLVAILLFPILLLWNRQRLPPRIYSLCMLGIILFRSFTEPLLFPTPFDFYFFAICFALSKDLPGLRREPDRRPTHVASAAAA